MGLFKKIKEKLFGKSVAQSEKYVVGLEKSRKNFQDKFKELVARYRNVDDSYFDEVEEMTKNDHFKNSFNILLVHNIQYNHHYSENGFDLVLSGHNHGGQWRIPGLINGLYSPSEGLFPEFAGGIYEVENTVFIVGRGLARNHTPIPRVFNRPELVIIDII